MGEEGYMNTAKTVMQTTQKLIQNISKIKVKYYFAVQILLFALV